MSDQNIVERLADLEAQVTGLNMVISAMLKVAPSRDRVLSSLRDMEEYARRENAHSGAIEILRRHREYFEG
jgi:hypothetical protein